MEMQKAGISLDNFEVKDTVGEFTEFWDLLQSCSNVR